jgi:hypothetical protein
MCRAQAKPTAFSQMMLQQLAAASEKQRSEEEQMALHRSWIPYYLTPRAQETMTANDRKMVKVFTFVDKGPGGASEHASLISSLLHCSY